MVAIALLFDLDGTMVDTDRLHLEAYRSLLNPLGRVLSEEDYKLKIMGAPNDAIMAYLFPDASADDHRNFVAAKENAFRSLVRDLEPTRGLRRVVAWADENNVEMAVVTNAPRVNAELMLNAIGFARFLPRLVIGDELPAAKPHPLPYQRGMELTGAVPTSSLTFEDSLSGIRAASAAGIFTYGLTTSLASAALLAGVASETISDFEAPALWSHLRSLVEHGRA